MSGGFLSLADLVHGQLLKHTIRAMTARPECAIPGHPTLLRSPLRSKVLNPEREHPMKLNARIPNSPSTNRSPCRELRTLLERAACEIPQPTVAQLGAGEAPTALRAFFEQDHVRGQTAPFPRLGLDVTADERAILEFILDDIQQPFILCGHAGSGKTTLLLYMTTILTQQIPAERRMFLPVYVALSDRTGAVRDMPTYAQLQRHLQSEIVRQVTGHLNREFSRNPAAALSWIARYSTSPRLHSRFGTADGEAASADPAGWIARFDDEMRHLLHWDILGFVSSNICRVVVFLDNVDRFSSDIHSSALNFGDELRDHGIRSVIAMRHSTYKELDRVISEKRAPSRKIELTQAHVRAVVQRRLGSPHVGSRLETGIGDDDAALARWFVGLLCREESIQLLTGLSCQNLHRIAKNLENIRESEYCTREIISQAATSQGPPQWLVYHAALSNYYGSFKSGPDLTKAGVVNLLCGKSGVQQPFACFCRLNILARLHGCTGSMGAGQLAHEYKQVFSGELFASHVLMRSLFQLTCAGLIVTVRCRRIDDERDIQRVLEDEADGFILSDSGRFYIESLVTKQDYLHMMKDDVELPQGVPMGYAKADDPRPRNFKETLLFLTHMADSELQTWESIAREDERSGPSKHINRLALYRNFFSARSLQGEIQTASFVRYIWQPLRGYLDGEKLQEAALKIARADLEKVLQKVVTKEAERAL